MNFLVRLLLGRPRACPWDKPGLSLGQTHFVPGTNPGFLRILHNGSPVCPWDRPSLSLGQSQGRRVAQKVHVLRVYVPFSLAIKQTGLGTPKHLSPSPNFVWYAVLLPRLSSLLCLAHRNRSDFFAICDCDAHRGPQKSRAISERRESNAALRFKVAMESR